MTLRTYSTIYASVDDFYNATAYMPEVSNIVYLPRNPSKSLSFRTEKVDFNYYETPFF